VTLSATIGIALSADATTAATDVVRNADIALYAGKARGKDRPQVFAEEMRAAVLGRITLKQELREGICRGEFALLYQPKVDSRSGLVVGVEALVRWNHPLRGLLMPDAFIALAEESGLIVDLDAWVLETACRQAAIWARSPAGPLPVAVNVSGRELERAGLLGRVRRVLAVTGLDPRLLELELTESAALQEEALSMLREIRALGIRIAIDDFGTGFSMLSRLQDFPFDTLKIDRSFISRITSVDADCPIVSATVAMGRGLGLEIVAEGVETEQQRAYLVRQGCGQLQGYLVSRPVAPQLIPAMLSSPPLPPIQDPRWVALESAIGVATAEPPLEELVRGLLVELQRLTGLDSVYLTRVCWERSEQEVLFSRNSGCITVRERLILPWPETLSQTAPTGSAHHTDRLPVEFLQSRAASTLLQQTSVSVPVLLSDGSIFGTLCGASGRHVPLTQPGLEVMRIFGSLIAAQIAGPMTSNTVSHRTELPLGE
jgi:EAL domain-containing protein (putative c-di-GMP-specific phosphodiesterase class I)